MPETTMICRVCGKRYKACRTPNTSGVFRWRDVACSPECGAEYLRRVQLARSEEPIAQSVTLQNPEPVESTSSDADIGYNCGISEYDADVSVEASQIQDAAANEPVKKKKSTGSKITVQETAAADVEPSTEDNGSTAE